MKAAFGLLALAALAAGSVVQAQEPTLASHDTADGLVLTPPMGWYPWNQFGDAQNEALIKEIAAAMVKSGMRDAGYTFVGPDEGVCFERGTNGQLTTVLSRYPGGLRGLGDSIHNLGLKYALYTDAGSRTCSKGMPGTKGHEYEDLRSFADWRCDYLKIDWCNTDGMNVTNAYQLLREARLAAGRPMVQSVCSWGVGAPWNWAASAGHLWRTTGDVCAPGHADWQNANKIAFFNQVLYRSAGPGHWNDPDMLIVGMPGMTAAQNRTIFSLWCIMAAPLIAGNDLRTMTPATVAVLTNLEAIAVDQDPLGIQGHVVRDANGVSVWAAKPLYDGSQAMALYNQRSVPAKVSVSWADLGLDQSAAFYVRDLWKHKTSGPRRRGITMVVPAAEVVMLRLAKTNAFPIPPIISADTYRLSWQVTGSAPRTLSGELTVKNAGTAALPLWTVRANLPNWLAVNVTQRGKNQTFVNTISTVGLSKGCYHALVRADNTEPLSGRPMSAIFYDVDLEISGQVTQN